MPLPQRSAETAPDVHITWYGHACFRIHDKGGRSVLTDPYDKSVGYRPPDTQPGVVTISHSHPDHSAISQIKGNPVVVRLPGSTGAGGLVFKGIPSWHDDQSGAKRGQNLIFIWEMSGIKLAHMGDFGQSELTDDQRAQLSHVDVLFIPVGGVFTIDGAQAVRIIRRIHPAVIIPMHYKTPVLTTKLQPLDEFLKGGFPVKKEGKADLFLSARSLPDRPTVYILDYVK